MCKPWSTGVCNCPGPRPICTCGVCQNCGCLTAEYHVKQQEEKKNGNNKDSSSDIISTTNDFP